MDEILPGDETWRILEGETAIKVWREYRGRSLEEVAARAGITPEELQGLEERRLQLTPQMLDTLAVVLDVLPAWIEPEEHELP